MKLTHNIRRMWATRDELSPRNFRATMLPVFLVLPLTIILGDIRFLDQQMFVWGVDSNNLIMMAFGVGFLPIVFIKERHIVPVLRATVAAQAALLAAQMFMGSGMARLIVYLAFHAVNGLCTVCGFYLFSFALNNVERLFTMVAAQLHYALTYLLRPFGPVSVISRTVGSAAVMIALVVAAFCVRDAARPQQAAKPALGAWPSGVGVIIALNMIYYVVTLMAMYIEYKEASVSAVLYGAGGLACIAIIFVVMLICNYSALHLWSLCLVCSVLGIGALHYAVPFVTSAGSFFYGLGEGLGFVLILYLQGGALKRSGSYQLLRLCCVFSCVNYVVISGGFYSIYQSVNAPSIHFAFPAVLVLTLACFLFSPLLQDKLFRTDWTDGYHMADMPLYAQALAQVERMDEERVLGLTPREMEVFTMLLTDASPKQIAGVLRVSYATVNFHSKNLYRKLGIQSRTELFTQYGAQNGKQKSAVLQAE